MKTAIFLFISALIFSCGSDNSSGGNEEVLAGKAESAVSAAPDAPPAAIDYDDLETFAGRAKAEDKKSPPRQSGLEK